MDHFVGCDLGKLTDPTALDDPDPSLAVNSLTGLPERTSPGRTALSLGMPGDQALQARNVLSLDRG